MEQKTLEKLEFNKILEKISKFSFSILGKEKILSLKPSINKNEIIIWQKETTEAVSMILKKGTLKVNSLFDISSYLKRASVDGILDIEELLQISLFLYNCQIIKNYSKLENENDFIYFKNLKKYFDKIELLENLEREINKIIISPTEIADNATEELSRIRKEIKTTNNKIKEQLNFIINSQTYRNMLQEAVITVRGDRYCVPVKAEYKNSFAGLVHDQSSTGATIFIEPQSIVQLNNNIKNLYYSEKQEIKKILVYLSKLVSQNKENLKSNLEALAHLDFVFAKGEYSISIKGTEPIFNESGYLDLKKARHPLIDKELVVETDIYLGKEFNTLLITGPNTGGKTVTLKTIGLFSVMGQSGLHIPAFDNSKLAIFKNIYVDIGDEQSIEQNLSTFSSHMKNIISIIDNVTDESLVLLDELGSGTDPTEGACIAISIINYLHNKNIRTVVTTHYSELKVFAISTDGVENASCEFDVETLKPTYKLLIGIPGKSNAFSISKKLGLPDFIIQNAKNLLSKENVKFEDVITDLEINKKNLILEKEKAETYRLEAYRLKQDVENQKKKTREQKQRILERATEEAKKIVAQAKFDADNIVKQVQKLARDKANQNEINEQRKKLKDSILKYDEKLDKFNRKKLNLKQISKTLKVGDYVFINSLNQSGTVTTLPNSKGEVMVKVGIMNVKANIKNLSLDTKKQDSKNDTIKQKKVSLNIKNKKSLNITSEIDLRGYYVEEALDKLLKYIDDAYLSSITTINIIHGKGTGALRNAIHNYLKQSPNILEFRLGEFGEGDSGVTVAKLK